MHVLCILGASLIRIHIEHESHYGECLHNVVLAFVASMFHSGEHGYSIEASHERTGGRRTICWAMISFNAVKRLSAALKVSSSSEKSPDHS